jgi:hypothetical protein
VVFLKATPLVNTTNTPTTDGVGETGKVGFFLETTVVDCRFDACSGLGFAAQSGR